MTDRHCVTQLNRLFRDNEKLELEIIGLESKLYIGILESNQYIVE